MLSSCYIYLVKFKKLLLSKILRMTYNLERREYKPWCQETSCIYQYHYLFHFGTSNDPKKHVFIYHYLFFQRPWYIPNSLFPAVANVIMVSGCSWTFVFCPCEGSMTNHNDLPLHWSVPPFLQPLNPFQTSTRGFHLSSSPARRLASAWASVSASQSAFPATIFKQRAVLRFWRSCFEATNTDLIYNRGFWRIAPVQVPAPPFRVSWRSSWLLRTRS